MSFSRLIARLMMVPLGLIAAILSVGLFLAFAILSIEPVPEADPAVHTIFTVFSGVTIASLFGSIALYPALLGVILCEFFSWRSIWVYLGFGLALSLFAFHAPAEPVDDIAMMLDLQAMAAGLIGGFVYWLIAGRGAGIVKRTLDNKPADL